MSRRPPCTDHLDFLNTHRCITEDAYPGRTIYYSRGSLGSRTVLAKGISGVNLAFQEQSVSNYHLPGDGANSHLVSAVDTCFSLSSLSAFLLFSRGRGRICFIHSLDIRIPTLGTG